MHQNPERIPWPIPEDVSEVIDVRAPAEFADDHIPGALNLPVFSDAERAEVGTIFKRQSPFLARKLGAQIICRNIALHMEAHFADKPQRYTPLIYCWRGGQRSASLATILAAVGWRTRILEGGYKTYRHAVLDAIAERCPNLTFRVLNGLTGSGKTRLLWKLRERGAQVLDLEDLASHKGSLLGIEPGESQPSQKYFESLLWAALAPFSPDRPIFAEAESRKVGNVHIPTPLWDSLTAAPVTEINTPLDARVAYLLDDYPFWPENPDRLAARLDVLRPRYGHEKIGRWASMIRDALWPELVRALLVEHYDPSYAKSANYPKPLDSLTLASVREAELEHAAEKLLQR